MTRNFVAHEPPCPPLDFTRHPEGEATAHNCCAARHEHGWACTILKTVKHTVHQAGGGRWVLAEWEDE